MAWHGIHGMVAASCPRGLETYSFRSAAGTIPPLFPALLAGPSPYTLHLIQHDPRAPSRPSRPGRVSASLDGMGVRSPS